MEQQHNPQYEQKYGRTWAHFRTSNGGILLLIVGVVCLFYFGWDYILIVPKWVWAALVLTPIIWTPWLTARARDDASLFLVAEGPQKISEYRVGKRVDVQIEGPAVPMTPRSGAVRLLLTKFDPNTRVGEGSALAEFTQFEMARDLATLDRLSTAFSEHLRTERVTQELIAVEVEKRVKQLSERWIGIAMATLEPEELETALSLTKHDHEIHATVEEVLDFE